MLHVSTAVRGHFVVHKDETTIFLIYYVPRFANTFRMLHLLQESSVALDLQYRLPTEARVSRLFSLHRLQSHNS